MNKTFIKVLSLAVMLMLVLSLFSGCNKKNVDNEVAPAQQVAEKSEIADGDVKEFTYDERVTVRLIHRLFFHNRKPLVEDDKVIAFLEDKFNMDIEWVDVPPVVKPKTFEKLNMMIATNDIPDIIELNIDEVPLAVSIRDTLVKNDKLINMKDFVEQHPDRYPNISANINHPSSIAYTSNDGNLHIIPRYYGKTVHAYIVRQDWLEELGIDMPNDLDDFYNMLKLFVEKDPDGAKNVGFISNGTWSLKHIYAGFTGCYEWKELDDGKIVSQWVLPEQKEAMKYVAKLYQEGLIAPDILTLSGPDAQASMANGKAGVTIYPIKILPKIATQMKEVIPDGKLSYLPVDMTGPNALARHTGKGFYEGLAINKDTKDPERVMDLIEYLLSDEGKQLTSMGVEGVHYTKDANGNITFNEEVYAHEGWRNAGSPSHAMGILVDQSVTNNMEFFDKELGDSFFGALDKLENIPSTTPTKMFRPQAIEEEVGTRPADIIAEYEAKFLTGALDIDEKWDEFVQKYRKAGYDRIEAEINK